VINASLDGTVFVHNQRILNPFKEFDLRRDRAQIKLPARQLPQKQHATGARSPLIQ
jgi:hypothetical protein